MPIPVKLIEDSIDAESLDELFDAGYIQFVVTEDELNIELTKKGLGAFDEEIAINQKDSGYLRFKKYLLIGIWLTSIVGMLIILFIKKSF